MLLNFFHKSHGFLLGVQFVLLLQAVHLILFYVEL